MDRGFLDREECCPPQEKDFLGIQNDRLLLPVNKAELERTTRKIEKNNERKSCKLEVSV